MCGHDAPPGLGDPSTRPPASDSGSEEDGDEDSSEIVNCDGSSAAAVADLVPGPAQTDLRAAAASDAGSPQQSAGDVSSEDKFVGFTPNGSMTRAQRMVIGAQCKQLIDLGRREWLTGQGWDVRYSCYCPGDVSGENKLIMAIAKQ